MGAVVSCVRSHRFSQDATRRDPPCLAVSHNQGDETDSPPADRERLRRHRLLHHGRRQRHRLDHHGHRQCKPALHLPSLRLASPGCTLFTPDKLIHHPGHRGRHLRHHRLPHLRPRASPPHRRHDEYGIAALSRRKHSPRRGAIRTCAMCERECRAASLSNSTRLWMSFNGRRAREGFADGTVAAESAVSAIRYLARGVELRWNPADRAIHEIP